MKRFKTIFHYLIAFILIFIFLQFSLARLGMNLNFMILLEFKTRILHGFIMTLQISIISLILSLLIGILTCAGLRSKYGLLKALMNSYVQFIRGTPLIMQIYLFFYIIGTAWGITNRFIAGVLILSVFEGAYIAEILRGGLNSINASQLEVAKAVGFNKKQTLRLVVYPQLFNKVLPALAGQFASIIKDSSLLSMISVIELMQTIREISATNYRILEAYFLLGILYLCLTLPLSLLTKRMERRFNYEA